MAESFRVCTPAADTDTPKPHPLASVLRAIDSDTARAARRLRGFAAALVALLPSEPSTHPLLKPSHDAGQGARHGYHQLHEAMRAARSLAEAVDEQADLMRADVDVALEEAFEQLCIKRGEA